MSRIVTIGNMYSKKFKTLKTDGIYRDVLGEIESSGLWLIYGSEKNGKTWLALMVADYFSNQKRSLYISAEEGLGMAFVAACQRAGLSASNKNIGFLEYTTITELVQKLDKRRSAEIIYIDNCTVYKEEIDFTALRMLTSRYTDKLFVFIAHEERNEPYTALAKLVRKLAKVIIRVEGLRATFSGRVPGGQVFIHKNKAELYHGSQNN